jgi:hypothetical protein
LGCFNKRYVRQGRRLDMVSPPAMMRKGEKFPELLYRDLLFSSENEMNHVEPVGRLAVPQSPVESDPDRVS